MSDTPAEKPSRDELVETVNILSDPDTMEAIAEAEADTGSEVRTVFMSFEPAQRVVWKYAANPKGVFRIPWDSDVVLFDYDPKTDSPWPHVWVETTPDHGPRTRTLLIHGTGCAFDGCIWQASCVDRKTGLVWHLYDITTQAS